MSFFSLKNKGDKKITLFKALELVSWCFVSVVGKISSTVAKILYFIQNSISRFVSVVTLKVVVGLTVFSVFLFTQTAGSQFEIERKVDRLHVIPGVVAGTNWENVDNIYTQDVSESGLFQSFTPKNSAYLKKVEVTIDAEDALESNPNPVPSESGSLDESKTMTTDDVESTSSSVEDSPEVFPSGDGVPAESSSDTGAQSLSDDTHGVFAFIDPVLSALPFASENITEEETPSVIDTSIADGQVTDDNNSEEDLSTSESTQTVEDIPPHLDTYLSHENSIVLSDFALPKLESGQFVTNMQLRVSLGGQYTPTEATDLPQVTVEYKTEDIWVDAGAIILDGEVSNALNGGYFLFALPTVLDTKSLEDLEVRLRYVGDEENLTELYLDSVWLDIDTETFDRSTLEERLIPEDLSYVKLPALHELISPELDFARTEDPVFVLRYESQRNIFVRFFRSIFAESLATIDSIKFIRRDGGVLDVNPTINTTDDGLWTIQLSPEDEEQLQPGTYAIQLAVNEGGKIFVDSFDFQWGMIAVNPNQTEYSVGDTAHISFASLSPNGNTVCDANLALYIIDPNQFISRTSVEPSGLCNGNNVIDRPDYTAEVRVSTPGVYEMYVERVGEAGEVLSHTKDTFMVKDSHTLWIDRSGPTRIYPPALYPMQITVHSESAFTGTVIEHVPANFVVHDTTASITEDGDQLKLSWDIDLSAHASTTLSYSFDAPDISPYLYTLGPAEVVSDDANVIVSEIVPASTTEMLTETITTNLDGSFVSPEETMSEDSADTEVIHDVPVTPKEEESHTALPTDAAPTPTNNEESGIIEQVVDAIFGNGDATETNDIQIAPEETQDTASTEPGILESIVDTLFGNDRVTPIEIAPVVPVEVLPVSSATNTKAFLEHRKWQIASDATGSMLLYWGSSTIPSGWTCVSCQASDVFYQRFIKGSSTPGINGGAATHTHTATGGVTATSATQAVTANNQATPVVAHTHTYTTPVISTDNNLPAYTELAVIQYNSAGSPPQIPAGAIALFDATVPSGWTQYAPLNGRYVRSAASTTAGTASSSNTHIHQISGSTQAAVTTVNAQNGGTTVSVAGANHTHTVSTTTVAQNHEPAYREAIFGRVTATSTPTDAMIAMWTDTPPSGWNTVSSSSEAFSNRFAKASTTYGGTGGASTSTHSDITGIISGGPSGTIARTTGAGANVSTAAHTHSVSVTAFTTVTTEPPFRTAIFAKRGVGGAAPSAPTIHVLFDNEQTGTSTPRFEFTGDDPDGVDTLVYQFQWDDDEDVETGPIGDRTSDNESGCSPNCFTNVSYATDTAPFNDNERVRFTMQTALTEGTTYYWHVRVKETVGNTWSSWSTIRSVTYKSGVNPSEWFQTQGQQFDGGTLTNTATSTGGVTATGTAGFITTQSAWAQQYSSATYPSGTVNASYSIATGTNRVLLVAIGSTRVDAGTQAVSVTYGGQSLSLAVGDESNANNPNHTYIFYLNDSGIAAATNTSLGVTITGGTSLQTYVYASVFAGVDQTTVYTDVRNYNDVAGDTTVGPFSAGLSIESGDQAVEVINLARSAVGNAARTITSWSNATWPAPSTVATSFTNNPSYALGFHINNRNATTSATESSQHTASGNAFDSMSAISLKTARQVIGSVMSPEVNFSSVSGQSNWGEIAWSVTEPSGTDTKLQLYYSSTTACDRIVPDAALTGNSYGFDAEDTGIHINTLSTTTYSRLCLRMKFNYSFGSTSPTLNDWTLRWVVTTQFTQLHYRWYTNLDAVTPTDPWGTVDLDEDTAIDIDSGVLGSDEVRLRMSLSATSSLAATSSVAFKLQYAEGDTCDASLGWQDVGAIGSTTALWRGYDNTSVADGATVSSTVLTNSTRRETYEEENNSLTIPTSISTTSVAEWDWVLQNNSATPGTNYCFRMVYSDGSLLTTYTNYPQLYTNDSPEAAVLYTPFDNEKVASTSPWFEFVSNDPEGQELDYQIQIDNNYDFTSTVIDTDSITNLDDFLNTTDEGDKSPFSNAQRMRYVIPSSLTDGVTYWWRVRAIDQSGSGSYGEWSAAQSFTIDINITISTWFQTTEAQFDTDTLEGTDATVANLVSFATGSTTGTTTSSAIDFSDATIGNAWGEFLFTETGSANDILYHLEYYDGSTWTIIPNADLAGNVAGFDTSPVNLLDLDTSVYSIIRIRADFRAGTPTLTDWTISWGERVSVPTLVTPFDNEKFGTTTPTFTFYSTDPQSEDLEYEISWSTDYNFSSGTTTRNSSTSPSGFTDVTNGADTQSPYGSGDVISYKIQAADTLSASSTYWWRVRAKDPTGSDSYSFWSDPWSFTTATTGESIVSSTWYQTLGNQFNEGTLSSATTSSSSVGIGGGLSVQSTFTSNTAVPGTTLSLTKPTGVVAGDLLLIIVGNDNNTATAQWNNTTLKPSGFTLINEAGNATPDAHAAAFYRIANGTESSATSTTAQSNVNYWGYYIRVTGASTTNPINVIGADYAVNNLLSHPITSITTTVDQALAFYVLSGDGGDTYPFSVSGTGWSESAEIQAGTLGTNAAGTWGTRLMSTAGATGNATVLMTVNDGAAGFQFAINPTTVTSGTITSPAIDFDDGTGPVWGSLSWKDVEPGSSQILYQVEYLNAIGEWDLIPDADLASNSTGFTTGPVDLGNLDTTTYNEIRLVANLNCSGANCPTLDEWTVTWSRGFTISGTAFEYDGVSSTTAGTVAVAVNGTLQTGKTGTIAANGTWSIDYVTFFSGNVVTVFVNDGTATATDEAVAITQYDGTPGISGMRLQKRHLTIGSDDHATISNSEIELYDFTDNENIFYDVDAGNDLTMCADLGCTDASIRILASNTYDPGTGANVTTHDFRNYGTFTAGANTVRVSGSWDDNATTTLTSSSVIFTATSSTEFIDENGATTTGFNNLTFGETSGTATWQASSSLDINGNLNVTYGTWNRGSTTITIAGNLTTGTNGYWAGMGTTTFDGSSPSTWTDQNTTLQNIGRVVVDGTAKTLLLGSTTTLQSLTIGADDTFDASTSGYTVSVYEHWVNNNVFTARTGKVIFIATTTNRFITQGNSSFYNLTFNGVGGAWSFVGADLGVTNDLTIATGTVTMPTGTTTITGSFSSVGGTFAHNNALMYFNASAAKTIAASGTPFTNAFYNIRFSGSGSWTFLDTSATTSNNFTITQGTVIMPNTTLTVGGNFINTAGTFTHNSGTINFTSTATSTIDTNASFYNLSFSRGGVWSFIDSSVTILNDLTTASGTLTLPSSTLTLGGSLANAATLTHNSGTILFNATTTGKTIDTGSSTLYNMTFNSLSGGWTITSNATTSNNFTLSTTSTFTLTSGKTLAVGGTFTNSTQNASTTWTGSTLSLEAGNYAINSKSSSGDTYGTLQVKQNTDIQMWNSSATTYSIDSTGSLYSEDHAGVDGDLYIFGEYVRSSGVEYWSYMTDFDGTALSTSTARQVDVRFASGTTALFGTSTLSITGTSTGTTTIANQGTGSYTITVLHGTTTASYYDFSNLGLTGLRLASSTKVTTLSDGRFAPGVASGTALTVSSSTIDANPALQIYRVDFSTTTAISAFNVTQNDGTPTSFWWFRNSIGNIDGEYFDNDTGDPGSVRWDDSSLIVTISGTVYSDDGITKMTNPTCDDATSSVRVVVQGGSTYSGSCASADGSYSIPNVAIIGDPVVTVYLNTGGGAQGTVVTKTVTGNISNLNIYQNRIITRHEDTSPLTIIDMAAYDADDDSDIRYTAATGTLTVFSNTELHIASSTTFAPGGDITIQGTGSSSSQDGSLHIDDNATFTGSATSTYTLAGSFTLDQGATFTSASTTVIMNATTTGKTITTPTSQEITFNTLTFNGGGGGWNINGDIRAIADINVTLGTVSGTANITVVNGSLSGNGLLSLGSGTTTINSTNTLGGTTAWTFANLVLGSGSQVGTTTPASNATTTILGKLTINTAHFLKAHGSYWNFAGTGNVFTETGTFIEATSTVRYSGAGASNVISTTYYNLDLMAQGSSPTYTATGLGIIVSNNFTLGGPNTTTFTLNTNDPAFDVNGNVTINTTGTLQGSNSGSFTAAGNWDNDGTFAGNNGTITFDGNGTTNISAGNSSFSSLTINGTGAFTILEHATTTGSFTLTNAGSFVVSSNQVLAVGGVFTNGIGGAVTTWTGSTLLLYSGTNYSINASTTSDVYNTLIVGVNTDIRMWNSSASTYTVDGTGSLYSQDHAGVDGALYIYGNYPGSGTNDYWSYETDFDGTSLVGSERKVDVYFASGASATILSGGLAVLGGSSASTTIQNQGSGTYAFRIGGSASTTWSHYELRNLDSSGLTFSGTPTISTLSHGDILVSQNGGTGMTVGGTVITQNPAKTFVTNVFATATAISAYNVTATGTTNSSWRFTQHSGNIAGEYFNIDPDGDPGYIVWDDSQGTITISGNVFSDEGSTVSTVCDSFSQRIRLIVGGVATTTTTSCNGNGAGGGTGFYQFTGVQYTDGDPIIVYIDGVAQQAATVTEDPVSNITSLDLYENRVIVRHEGIDPLSIFDMSLWDSSDDPDIPFTAVDSSPDTLTLPANKKLIVSANKTFQPNGNVTLSGGGGGAAYDGTLELFANASFDSTGSESHTIGGSLIMGTGATFDDETSTVTFTTTGSARTIDTNEETFYNLVLNGSGSWTVTNTALSIGNDFTITQGAVTLPAGTTTVTGSLSVTSGSFITSTSSYMVFNSAAAETVRPGTSSFGTLIFNGAGSFTMLGSTATVTKNLLIVDGTVTAVTGTTTIVGDFINSDVFTHGSGILKFTATTSALVTTFGSDLYSAVFAGGGSYTFTNTNVALLGSLSIQNGTVTLATGTMSIAGSFLNTGGSFNHSSGTILFNSSDTGEIINPGTSPFYVVTFASAGGGWTITNNATSTSNFSITSATNFTVSSSTRLYVGGVFTNLVGGSATTWTGSTLVIDSGSGYTINTRSVGGDTYNNLRIGSSTALRAWDSTGSITITDSTSSFYSQDNAGVSGALYIYGNYVRSTGSDYWSYGTDFDGTVLGGGSRQAFVYIASGATTTFTGGALNIIGASGFDTTIANQGSGTYAISVTGGALDAQYYSFANMDINGLTLSGETTITSLLEGNFTLGINGGSLITLSSTTLNYNTGITISGVSFATTTVITGYNVTVVGTTPSAWTFTAHTGNLDGEAFDSDGVDACGSIRWDDSTCLITQQSAYRFRNDDGGEGVPDSEWYNTSWTKRKRITVTNDDAVSYTNAAVKFTVPYDSDMQTDFDDLRFTDSTGLTLASHFIESYTTNTQAIVWLKVPLLATSTDTTFYMYYGNGTATDTSATTTFSAMDNFEDGNVTEYSGDTSKFTVDSSGAYERTYRLEATDPANGKTTQLMYNNAVTVRQGESLRFFNYIDTASGSGDEICTHFGVQTATTSYAVCLELFGVDRMSISKNAVNRDTSGTVLASTTVTYSTGWYEVEIDWGTNNVIAVTLSQNGSVVATTSATDSSYTSGGVGYTLWGYHGGIDIYSARPLLTSEPTTTIGSEQVSGGASWVSALNTVGSGFSANENFRIRFLVENSGLPITNQNYELEYAAKGAAPSCEAVNFNAFVEVPDVASCNTSPLCMQGSTYYTNLASTTDVLGGDGTFTAGQIVEDPSNNTTNISVGAGEFTELEYTLSSTVNTSDSSYCLRVSNEGTDLDSYAHVAELALVFVPNITIVSLNGGNDITLFGGVTTTITATGTVSDANGYSDLIDATTTIFRSGVGESCTADNNNCYIAGNSSCSFINCLANSCDVTCTADLYYHADPTDVGTYAAETWRALLAVVDSTGLVATATAPSVDLITLRSIDIASGIDYGTLTPNEDTGSYNASTTVQNIGNVAIDLSIEGTDLTDGASSLIPVNDQKFATSTFTYSACTYCSTLGVTPTSYELDLTKPTTTISAVTDEIFWGISVPFGVAGVAHSGINTFTPISD